MADSHLDPLLNVNRLNISSISHDCYNYFKLIKETQPNVMDKLVYILRTKPDSDVQQVHTNRTDFATWRKDQRRDVIANWDQYSRLLHDPDHTTYWAIMAAKMLSIARHLRNKGSVFIDYSAQYLMDFAPLPREEVHRKRQRSSCCKRLSIEEGLKYGLENNLPKEEDWKYVGCRDISKPAHLPLFPMVGEISRPSTVSGALVFMKYVPVAAKLHTFHPDLALVEDEIYRGPKYLQSRYTGLKDVMIYATKIVDGELVALVNLPWKKLEKLHVSLDWMLVQTPREDDFYDPYEELATPTCLLTNFCALIP